MGVLSCLLAGCALQPAAVEARPADNADKTPHVVGRVAEHEHTGHEHTGHPGAHERREHGTSAAAVPIARQRLDSLARGNQLRIGVEFLPPAAEETALAVPPSHARAETVAEPPTASPPERVRRSYGDRERAERHTWTMSAEDLASIRNPVARETLHFLDDLMGEDRRRLKRELGTPLLTMQAIDFQSPGIDLYADERQAEEEAIWMSDEGIKLLQRPFRHLLRRLPMVEAFEDELDEFKSDNVPLSEAYVREHRTGSLGRVSMKLRSRDLTDPVEIVYKNYGLRIGTSQRRLKVGFAREILQDLHFEVRTRRNYDSTHWRIRADLSWVVSPTTSLHLLAGDDLDFLATSSVYSLFDSPMDGSPGVLVYAVHLF